MTEIDRERWQQLQAQFGCDEAPLGHPRVYLTDAGLSVGFGEGDSHVSVWATRRVTRIDVGDLELYISTDQLLLLLKVGPHPVRRWRVLYDSSDMAETDPAVPLVKEILAGAKHPSATLAEHAVQIVRTVRATVPLQ